MVNIFNLIKCIYEKPIVNILNYEILYRQENVSMIWEQENISLIGCKTQNPKERQSLNYIKVKKFCSTKITVKVENRSHRQGASRVTGLTKKSYLVIT